MQPVNDVSSTAGLVRPMATHRRAKCVRRVSATQQLICENAECSLPAEERERLPIRMRDTIQLVGYGDKAHVVIDGGILDCFTGHEEDVNRCRQRTGDIWQTRGQLLEVFDMMDAHGQDDAASRLSQAYWFGHGSRNLVGNLTFLRGGYRSGAIRVGTSREYALQGRKTALRIHSVDFEEGYSIGEPLLVFNGVDHSSLN